MLLKRLSQSLSLHHKTNSPFSLFVTASTLRFDDVAKFHEDNKGHYTLKISGKTLTLDPTTTIKAFRQKTMHKYPHIKTMRIFDEELIEFADAASTRFLLEEDFIMKINTGWFSVLTELESPVFQFDKNHNLKYEEIYKLYQYNGYNSRETAVLGKFIASLIEDLSDHAHSKMDSNLIRAIVDKNLYELSVEAKLKVTRINIKLEALNRKLKDLQRLKDEVDARLERRGRRRIKYLSFFVMAQVLALQYVTYVAASWDVVEPIANLLGILEVITAYAYWLTTNKSFSYHHIKLHYIEQRMERKYRKYKLDIQEYEDTKELIRLLEAEKLILSPKITEAAISLRYASDVPGESSDDEEEDLPLPIN